VNISNRLVTFPVTLAVLGALSFGAAAEAKPNKHHRHFANRPHYHRSLRVTAGGELTDSQGWRKRDNAKGWDNTCFNLDYLSSMYACSAGRR
jgi:hypothetical protein